MDEELKRYLPLPPAAMHILLALADENRHGYGIMLEVKRQTSDQYKLGPGTLYDNLDKLLGQRLVAEANAAKDADARRRYYALTDFGKKVLAADVARLEEAVKTARRSLKLARQS